MSPTISVLQMIHSLKIGGSEKLAATISEKLDRNRFRPSVCALDVNGDLAGELDRQGIPHHVLHRRGVEAGVLRRIYRVLKMHQVDVVHTHHFAQLFYTVLPARMAGARIVHTEHEHYTYLENAFSRRAIRPLLRVCSRFTTVSKEVSEYFIRDLGVSRDRITTVPNGIDIPKFDIRSDVVRKELGLGIGATVFGTIGRLEEEKDHRSLLNAFSNVVGVERDARLLVIGDGSLRKSLEGQAKRAGIEENILFLGSRIDIPEILSSIDIFVLSSIREGLPIAVIEAMAARKPVICTNVGGLKSLVQDGENGILVPPQDEEALCRAMTHLMEHPEIRMSLGEKAHGHVRDTFGVDAMIGQYETIYESMLEGRHVRN